MNGLGSGDNGEFTFLDIITLLGFSIGIANFNENITQSDVQNLQKQLSDRIEDVLNDIHLHLQEQDEKIDMILEELNASR